MLGFADQETDDAYGLISSEKDRRGLTSTQRGGAAMLFVGGCIVLGVLAAQGAAAPSSMSMMVLAAEETCATKPYHQCAGMNFSTSAAERKAYDFAGEAKEFSCCPDGHQCTKMGPV